MASFWKIVNKVINESDVIIEVIDSRFPEETSNLEIEEKIAKLNKNIIYVLNKSDLIKIRFSDFVFHKNPHIFISAKNNLGTTKLRRVLSGFVKDKPILVGVLGYPNTGKSSLINALKQKKSAKVSSTPGFTRGMQKIRISKNIYLIDTPGVFANKKEKEGEEKDALVNTKDYRKIKEPEYVALEIIKRAMDKNPQILKDLYKIKPSGDPDEILHTIAVKFNWLIKGGKPNIDQTSRKIIQDWQRGKLIV